MLEQHFGAFITGLGALILAFGGLFLKFVCPELVKSLAERMFKPKQPVSVNGNGNNGNGKVTYEKCQAMMREVPNLTDLNRLEDRLFVILRDHHADNQAMINGAIERIDRFIETVKFLKGS